MKQVLSYIGIYLGKAALTILFGLNRKVVLNKKFLTDALATKKSVLICCWHGRLLFPLYFLRESGAHGLAGLHRDAEIISKVGGKMGWKLIRGSSSEGGTAAYKGLISVLKEGDTVVGITPDGPRGPKREAKRGAVRAAMLTGAIIIPVSGQASRRWEFKNWDVFVVPKPGGRISMVFGKPIIIHQNSDVDEGKNCLDAALNRCQEMANAIAVNKA